MKNKLQFILQLIAISWLIFYFYQNKDDFYKILEIDTISILCLLFLVPIGILIRSIQLISYLKILNFKIPIKDSIKLNASSTLLNYLPLNIGFFYKAKILKNYLAVKYSQFLVIHSFNLILVLVNGSLMGLIVLFINWDKLDTNKTVILFILLGALVVSFAIICFPYKKIPLGSNFISKILEDILFAFSKIRKSYKTIFILSIYPTLHLLLIGLNFWIAFNATGHSLDLFTCVLFAIITNLFLFVNITPQNIGIREIFIGLISVSAGNTFSDGLIVSTIIRIAGLVMHFIIGLPSLRSLDVDKPS